MLKLQHVSVNANKELNEYAESVKAHFMDDTYTLAETSIVMDSCLEEW